MDHRSPFAAESLAHAYRITGSTDSASSQYESLLGMWRRSLGFKPQQNWIDVNYYSGIIYQAMGFKPEMFTVLFAIPRTVGWLAQWQEMLQDSEQKIARPRQIFAGSDVREVVPIDKRMAASGRRCVRKFRILQERLGVESRL